VDYPFEMDVGHLFPPYQLPDRSFLPKKWLPSLGGLIRLGVTFIGWSSDLKAELIQQAPTYKESCGYDKYPGLSSNMKGRPPSE